MSAAKTFFIYFMTTYSTFPIWSVFADVFNKFTLAIKLVAFCHVLAPPILSGFHLPRQYVRQHRIHCNAHNAIQQFHRRRISAAVLISQKRLHAESRVCRHIADIGNIPNGIAAQDLVHGEQHTGNHQRLETDQQENGLLRFFQNGFLTAPTC